MSKKTSLILFDIDGTLLTSGGAGERALRLGFAHAFGIKDDLHYLSVAGRTDSGIARQVLTHNGLQVTPENLERFFNGYLHFLPNQLLERPGQLLPGILNLLQELRKRTHLAVGLLTGNLERGAKFKLQHYGVHEFFEFGAFADDHHDRNQLGAFAKTRAETLHTTSFAPENIYILGDTPHDVECARSIGAKAVAVATGVFNCEQLAEYQPDFLFSDLSDLPSVLEALGEPAS